MWYKEHFKDNMIFLWQTINKYFFEIVNVKIIIMKNVIYVHKLIKYDNFIFLIYELNILIDFLTRSTVKKKRQNVK